MPTQKGGYWIDGKRVPSVTTVLWSLHPDGIEGLMGWQKKLILAGKSPDEERDRAAAIGNLAHAAIEDYAAGKRFSALFMTTEPDIAEPAKQAYEAFLEWIERTRFQITHTEVSLVSKKHGFGGTLDAAGLSGNLKRAMADWKTSNTLNIKMLMQTAAYKELWNENFPDDQITDGGIHLLRFNKTNSSFSDVWLPELDNEFESFLDMLKIYERCKISKKKLP